jgi:hypothetical protein
MVLRLLRTLPPEEGLELLEAIHNDAALADDWDMTSYEIPTSSEHNLLRSLLGPTRNHMEFELTVRYPVAYPPLFPINVTSLALETLLKPSMILVDQEILKR